MKNVIFSLPHLSGVQVRTFLDFAHALVWVFPWPRSRLLDPKWVLGLCVCMGPCPGNAPFVTNQYIIECHWT